MAFLVKDVICPMVIFVEHISRTEGLLKLLMRHCLVPEKKPRYMLSCIHLHLLNKNHTTPVSHNDIILEVLS